MRTGLAWEERHTCAAHPHGCTCSQTHATSQVRDGAAAGPPPNSGRCTCEGQVGVTQGPEALPSATPRRENRELGTGLQRCLTTPSVRRGTDRSEQRQLLAMCVPASVRAAGNACWDPVLGLVSLRQQRVCPEPSPCTAGPPSPPQPAWPQRLPQLRASKLAGSARAL